MEDIPLDLLVNLDLQFVESNKHALRSSFIMNDSKRGLKKGAWRYVELANHSNIWLFDDR